ncbi:pentapeptide repeat-containing protein [Nocardia sp. NPDC057440]|uniref:pentapeptide repeat-containing protein n=1 Tax=Nocardia sp. NPDC057440 TaxID=3346134 RepID=UPI00366B3A4D
MFNGHARFHNATFDGGTVFHGTTFNGHAGFDDTTFDEAADFGKAMFNGTAGFSGVTFTGPTTFSNTDFGSERVTFDGPLRWGPPAPEFDWDQHVAEKPANVEPRDWPPAPARTQCLPADPRSADKRSFAIIESGDWRIALRGGVLRRKSRQWRPLRLR